MPSTPETSGAQRAQRMADAMQLKQPDRVPLIMPIGYMLAELGGITKQQLLADPDRSQELLEQAALHFQPDSIHGPMPFDPTPYLLLGDRMTAWPGHGLDENTQFQFVESEFMKAEDYDAFLEDPTDWVIRTYLPRAFEKLDGFATMPPLSLFVFGSYYLNNVGGFGTVRWASPSGSSPKPSRPSPTASIGWSGTTSVWSPSASPTGSSWDQPSRHRSTPCRTR